MDYSGSQQKVHGKCKRRLSKKTMRLVTQDRWKIREIQPDLLKSDGTAKR